MILNARYHPLLFNQGTGLPVELKIKNNSFALSILEMHLEEHKQYWYIEFNSPKDLEVLPTVLNETVLGKLRNNTLTLVLSNVYESFHDVVGQIYKIAISNLNIPEENIVVVSGSADILTEIKTVSALYNRKEIKAIWSLIFEATLRNYTFFRPNSNNTLQYKHYDKKFLNFNRRWRLHRPLFVALLKIKNMLDLGHVSLAHSDDGNTWETVWYNMITCSSPGIVELLESNKNTVLNIPEMYLDTEELVENKPDPAASSDKYYSSSYFSVVSETNFYTSVKHYDSGRFFTEKIFKPIYQKHPFVLISTPKSLELLKTLGYKTFGEVINEDYDNEMDDSKRMLMILDEVNRLSNLSDSELFKFLDYAKPICEYNYQHLNSKDISRDFIKWLN